ncbi:hypothetical protein, partial [Lactobacillus acidophilus]|uniref:hypothetical protein n=2 Tax=Lactobacillus acidophilus TaxID=1579 RepID=UPI0021A27600
GIKEVKFINPGALVEHVDDVEELLLLTLLCSSIKDVEMGSGKRVSNKEAMYLPSFVVCELLGKLGVSGNDIDKFIDDVQAGKNKLFEKYWAKYSEVVKKIAGGK